MRMGMGMGMGAQQQAASGASELPEVTITNAYYAKITALGGTQPDTAMKAAILAMVKTLYDAGIWAKLDALFIVANTAANSLINMINPNIVATNNGAVDWTAKIGWRGGVGKYLDLGVNLTTTTKYTGGKGTLFVMLGAEVTGDITTQCMIGSAVAAANNGNYILRMTGAITAENSPRVSIYSDTTVADGTYRLTEYVAESKNNTTQLEYYVATARVSETDAGHDTSNVFNGNVFGCARNTNGTPLTPQKTGNIAIMGVGGYLTGGSTGTIDGEHATLRTALATYLAAIA